MNLSPTGIQDNSNNEPLRLPQTEDFLPGNHVSESNLTTRSHLLGKYCGWAIKRFGHNLSQVSGLNFGGFGLTGFATLVVDRTVPEILVLGGLASALGIAGGSVLVGTGAVCEGKNWQKALKESKEALGDGFYLVPNLIGWACWQMATESDVYRGR